MINLLPGEIKSGYRYARFNVGLRKWLVVFAFAIVGLGAIGTTGLAILHQANANYQRQAASLEQQLEKAKLKQTKAEVNEISNSLKLAVQVLGNEVLFSKLIQQIGSAMPKGTVLTGLTINQTKGGIDLKAGALNYTAATQIQVNLTDPENKIFAKADINSINCGTAGGNNFGYPCSVDIRALFNDDNPFLFINQGKKP
jgi:hypothetical protein